MMRAFALVAMIVLAGLVGTAAVSAEQTQLATTATGVAPVAATETAVVQQISAVSVVAADIVCCDDQDCFNPNHCHHAGPSAVMASPVCGLVSTHRCGLNLRPHRIPVQRLTYPLSKPPKA